MDLTKLSEIEILALTIYGESRGESIEGQIAVGCVIRNRLIPTKTYNDVCLAKEQFSCWNESDPNYPILVEIANKLLVGQNHIDLDFIQCNYVAFGIFNRLIKDNTNGAIEYLVNSLYNSYDRPSWASTPKGVKQIGNQTFFEV